MDIPLPKLVIPINIPPEYHPQVRHTSRGIMISISGSSEPIFIGYPDGHHAEFRVISHEGSVEGSVEKTQKKKKPRKERNSSESTPTTGDLDTVDTKKQEVEANLNGKSLDTIMTTMQTILKVMHIDFVAGNKFPGIRNDPVWDLIANECGLKKITVLGHLSKLKRWGYIIKEGKRGKSKDTTTYVISDDLIAYAAKYW